MARNKTQPKIERFLVELTKLCQEHGMIVDANGGGGVHGAGKTRSDSRFKEGCPLVLFTKSGVNNNFRKVGYFWYSFSDDEEQIFYNFDPKPGTPYKEIVQKNET
jgi:hypothetical protein